MKRLKVFEVPCARSVVKYLFRSYGNRDSFFNYSVSFDLIMHSRKEGWFHRSYAMLIGTKKGSNPTGLVWVSKMASVSFLWDTNMANLKSWCECHVDFGYRTFDRLGRQTVTSGYVVVFQFQITKTIVSQLRKLQEYIVSCYKPFSWTEKAVETFN